MRHLQFSHDIRNKIRRKNEEKEDSILIVIELPTTKQYFLSSVIVRLCSVKIVESL